MNARIVPAADVQQGDLILWDGGLCHVSAIDNRGGGTITVERRHTSITTTVGGSMSWVLTCGETSRQVAGVGLLELVAVVTESEDE